jgi:hypothetical protein
MSLVRPMRCCQLQRIGGDPHLALLFGQPHLGAAKCKIFLADLGLQHHQRIVRGIGIGLLRRLGIFHLAPHQAEQIELPACTQLVLEQVDRGRDGVELVLAIGRHGGAQARLHGIDGGGQRVDARIGTLAFQQPLHAQLLAHEAAGATDIRQPLCRGLGYTLMRFHHPQHRLLQARVAGDRLLHHRIQHLIVELRPPKRVRVAGRRGTGGPTHERRPHRGCRRYEIRPDRAAGEAGSQQQNGNPAHHFPFAGRFMNKAAGISASAMQPVI